MAKIEFKYRNIGVIICLILYLFPMSYKFYKEELKSYQISFKQINTETFEVKVAKALKNTIDKETDTVLILGGYTLVGRLVNYKPFMGHLGDGALYGLPKLFGTPYINNIYEGLKAVNVVYKTPDYPNLFWIGEDEDNVIYKYIENYLASHFEIAYTINPINCYPHNYQKGVIIYKRKDK